MNENIIEQLQQRYGRHELYYQPLSEQQRRFLLHSSIAQERDAAGDRTISITSIVREGNETRLELNDSFNYAFHRNMPAQYSQNRIKSVKAVLNLTEEPEKVERLSNQVGKYPEVYLFKLPNDFSIQVTYDVIRDRV